LKFYEGKKYISTSVVTEIFSIENLNSKRRKFHRVNFKDGITPG